MFIGKRSGCVLCLFCMIVLLVSCREEKEISSSGTSGREVLSSETDGKEVPDPETGRESEASADIVSEISIVCLNSKDSYVKRMAVDFDKENPQYAVSYENKYENRDSVLAEVMNGSGPDILCVDWKDMENLQRNGALGEMEPLLTDDISDQSYPAAIGLGTLDGKLFGLPITVYISSILVNSSVYDGDTWSMEDVLATVRAHPEIKWMFADEFGDSTWRRALVFLLWDLEHSAFVEGGEGHFDSPEFKEILSLVKEKANDSERWEKKGSTLYEKASEAVCQGDYMGVKIILPDLNSYGLYVANGLGDGLRFIGYPMEKQDSGMGDMVPLGMVVVNQAAVDKPGVGGLLRYLYSLENQETLMSDSGASIRRDVLDKKVVYNEYAEGYFWVGKNDSIKLPWDGKSDFYLEEYKNLLENTVPHAYRSEELMKLILEDVAPYFDSDKDLEEVVQSVNKRVNLYLSERQ